MVQYELPSREGRITVFRPPLIPPLNELLWTRGTGRCLWYKIQPQLCHEERALKWWDALRPVWIWCYFLKFTRFWDVEERYTVPSFTRSKLYPTLWRTQKKDNKVFFPSLCSCSCSLEKKMLIQLFSLEPNKELHITKTIKGDFQYKFANSAALCFGKWVFCWWPEPNHIKNYNFSYVFKRVYSMVYW